jgi:hypothetical protein
MDDAPEEIVHSNPLTKGRTWKRIRPRLRRLQVETSMGPSLVVVSVKGSRTTVGSRDPPVFVNETAEDLSSIDPASFRLPSRPRRAFARGGQIQPPMGPLLHVVAHVHTEHPIEMPTPVDQHMVEALRADRPHEPLGERIGLWRPDRGADDPELSVPNISSNGPENFASRSRKWNRIPVRRSSMARFLACWVTHQPGERWCPPSARAWSKAR